jgi:hypothetical protein
VYDKERKFHVAKPYGCHMPHHNRYMCNSNDGPLTDFLKDFVPANPNTAVIIASDHGFHWMKLQVRSHEVAMSERFYRVLTAPIPITSFL